MVFDSTYNRFYFYNGMTWNTVSSDDLGDHRPGLQAAADFAVRSPLVDAGLGNTFDFEFVELGHMNRNQVGV